MPDRSHHEFVRCTYAPSLTLSLGFPPTQHTQHIQYAIILKKCQPMLQVEKFKCKPEDKTAKGDWPFADYTGEHNGAERSAFAEQ